MGANKTASTRKRGYTISQIQNVIYADYKNWLETGEQHGVFNFIGPSGIGKTECIYQIADRIRSEGTKTCQVIELYLSALIDPESAAGIPIPVDQEYRGKTRKVLSLAAREEILAAMEAGRGAFLFIDEIGREADQMRPMLMKLLHEKKLGGLDVSDCYLLVAGNPVDNDHNVTAIQEDAAISSRLIDVAVRGDVKEMADYFYKFSHSHKVIADYVLENRQMLDGRDADNDQASKYRNPRAWFNAASKLHIHGGGTDKEAGDIMSPTVMMVLTGIIGPTTFASLRNFLSKTKPLGIKEILAGKFQIPITLVPPSAEQSIKAFLSESELTDDEADNLVKYLDNIPADRARAIMREASAGNILPKNNKKFTARNLFRKYTKKITNIA